MTEPVTLATVAVASENVRTNAVQTPNERPLVRTSAVQAASEFAYCHGILQEWVPVGRGWYACRCCGVERKLVGTRG